MSDEDSMNLSIAEQQEDEEFLKRQFEIDKEQECDNHLWVRNRVGRWCAYCGIVAPDVE